MVACMAENNVPFKEDESKKLDSITWMQVYRLTNGKPFPDTEECFLPRPCQQCEGSHGHSPCVSVCPATATDYDMDTGIVSQIYTRCFGCRYCMVACPFGVPAFEWEEPTPWIRKCDFCADRQAEGLEPACVEAAAKVPGGEGALVWDVDGNRFIDFTTGIAVTATGHAHPAEFSGIRKRPPD